MVQRVQVILEDDVDGGAAAETVRFGLDGVEYEIDLSEANAEKLRNALALWVGNARKVSGRKRAQASAPARSSRFNPTEVRAWASQNGYRVNSRGRVPSDILEAYEKAHA